jgi:RNA polymerase sigma-70 factor, ECF subfamily
MPESIEGLVTESHSTDEGHPESPAPEWERFLKGLRRFVARRVSADDAPDVVQNVLLRLHQGAAGLRDGSRAEAWLYAIARRTIADHYRSRGATLPATTGADLDELPGVGPLPSLARWRGQDSHSAHEEVLSWLRPIAEGLPDKYRRAILMADFEGRPQQEVADALGLSLSGAKSRVQRARAKLGEALERCCAVELGPDGRVVDFARRGGGCAPNC